MKLVLFAVSCKKKITFPNVLFICVKKKLKAKPPSSKRIFFMVNFGSDTQCLRGLKHHEFRKHFI